MHLHTPLPHQLLPCATGVLQTECPDQGWRAEAHAGSDIPSSGITVQCILLVWSSDLWLLHLKLRLGLCFVQGCRKGDRCEFVHDPARR